MLFKVCWGRVQGCPRDLSLPRVLGRTRGSKWCKHQCEGSRLRLNNDSSWSCMISNMLGMVLASPRRLALQARAIFLNCDSRNRRWLPIVKRWLTWAVEEKVLVRLEAAFRTFDLFSIALGLYHRRHQSRLVPSWLGRSREVAARRGVCRSNHLPCSRCTCTDADTAAAPPCRRRRWRIELGRTVQRHQNDETLLALHYDVVMKCNFEFMHTVCAVNTRSVHAKRSY